MLQNNFWKKAFLYFSPNIFVLGVRVEMVWKSPACEGSLLSVMSCDVTQRIKRLMVYSILVAVGIWLAFARG